jgi:phosphoglycolate phosphatase
LTDKLVWLVEQEQGRHIDELDPVPGLRKVLTELKHRGYRLGIVSSNIGENIEAYLTARKMNDLFSFTYADGKVSHKGELMKKMMKEQKLVPEQVIYVGDEPRDVLAARGVGVKTVGVTWGFQPKKAFAEVGPEWLISKPKELLSICPPRSWWDRLVGSLRT